MERFNGTLKISISRILKIEEENLWDLLLRTVELAYNVSIHISTVLSAFKMQFE